MAFFLQVLCAFFLFLITPKIAHSQCSSITVKVDTNVSCAPGVFTFMALNVPSGSIIEWNFGKGPVIGKDTFKMIQPSPTELDLEITIFFPKGTVCTKKYSKIVRVLDNPKPQMFISDKYYCSTSDPYLLVDKTPNSVYRIWNIEGVNYGSSSDTLRGNFTSDGKKNVLLLTEDQYGCRAAKSFVDAAVVLDNFTVGIAGTNRKACITTDLSFSPKSTFPATEIKSIKWSFPGGTPSSSSNIRPSGIRYLKGGYYKVGVEIETNKGCSYQYEQDSFVHAIDSTVLDLDISDSVLCLPETFRIDVKNQALTGELTWQVTGHAFMDSISRISRTYYFGTGGKYDFGVTYQDTYCISRVHKNGFIDVKKVQANLGTKQYYDCEIPFLAKFTNSSSASESGSMLYKWTVYDTFGKPLSTTTTTNFDYYVDDTGYYHVELIATHSNGCSDTLFQERLIRADSIRIDFLPVPKLVCLNQFLDIQNKSLPGSYRSSDYYSWWVYKHGDTSQALDSSYQKSPTFQATYDGSYDILVKARNDVGCTQTYFRENAFEVIRPKADFKTSYDTVCRGDDFTLVSNVNPDGDYTHNWRITNAKDTFEWINNREPKVTIDSPGVYDVRYDISILGLCRDTITKKGEVTISGVFCNIDLPSNRACRNLGFKPKAIIDNRIYGSTKPGVNYEWTVFPSTGFVMKNETTDSPELIFSENGEYVIRLVVKNKNLCVDTSFSDTIIVGLNPKVTFSDTSVCSNAPIHIVKSTDTFTNRWYHSLTPTENYTVQKLNTDTASLQIAKHGDYIFSLVASRDSLCFDTVSSPIHIVSPVADFYHLDSSLYCAPVYERFRSTSQYADTLFWDFGDGKKLRSTDYRVTTLYEENTGNLTPYTVQLIAKNRSGCSDTITKPGLITVQGPAVRYKLVSNRGCEPLEVKLVGQTDNVEKMYIDYGDGGDFGYSLDQVHTYYNKWRIIEQEYEPVVLVVDKQGCLTAVKSDSSVFVKPSPKARIGLTDSASCHPLTTTYYNLGEGAKSWFWDFDGNGSNDGSNASGKYTYTKSGIHNLTLINFNDFGCSDTAIRVVTSSGGPEVIIGAGEASCLHQEIRFVDLSVYNVPIRNRTWTFNSGGDQTTTSDSIVSFIPTQTGTVNINLKVSDTLGCPNSANQTANVKDSMNDEAANLYVVSVLPDNSILVTHQSPILPYRTTEFLKASTGIEPVYFSARNPKVAGIIDSTLMATAATEAQCYETRHIDSCGYLSKKSETHCTIFLQVDPGASGKNELTWTPYVGWRGVKDYTIYRMVNNQQKLLATVAGDVLNFTDSLLCDSTYCYVIEASHPTENYKSRSNLVCAKPSYELNVTPVHIEYATVVDDQFIRVKIEDNPFQLFELEKTLDGTVVERVPLDDVFYDDMQVEVNKQDYSYRAKSVDHCNTLGPAGRAGSSIWLRVEKTEDIHFVWNPYRDWPLGVQNYQLKRLENGSFRDFIGVDGGDTSVTVPLTKELGSSNCFVVEAVNQDNTRVSLSNMACIEGEALVFIPNASRPLSEVGNNVFKPSALLIKSPLDFDDGVYDFKVFNRWGELIFATSDPAQGWDGTYMAKDAPAGAYFYWLAVRGLDSKMHYFSGTVNLIR